MKNFFSFIIIIGILAGALFYLSRETADPNRQIVWGITFSQLFAQKMGLDWQKVYLAISDDLKIKKLRLIAYWPEIEPVNDIYNFAHLDWMIEQAASRDAKIILAVGHKLPRWPECHQPSWVADQNKELLEYIEAAINHYKNESVIVAWEVENEPFLNFGECPALDVKLLDEEIALVRKLDNRPIIITDSGELSLWVQAAKRADIFGTTMYRYVWHKWLGSYKYPISPGFFRAKERITRWFVGQEKAFIVIELQGEPWYEKQLYEIPTEKQLELLNFEEFKSFIEFAKKTGFSEYYLWGGEWWWSLKQQGHPEYWDYVKNLIH